MQRSITTSSTEAALIRQHSFPNDALQLHLHCGALLFPLTGDAGLRFKIGVKSERAARTCFSPT